MCELQGDLQRRDSSCSSRRARAKSPPVAALRCVISPDQNADLHANGFLRRARMTSSVNLGWASNCIGHDPPSPLRPPFLSFSIRHTLTSLTQSKCAPNRYPQSCHPSSNTRLSASASRRAVTSRLRRARSGQSSSRIRGVGVKLTRFGPYSTDHELVDRLQQWKHVTKSLLHYYKVSKSRQRGESGQRGEIGALRLPPQSPQLRTFSIPSVSRMLTRTGFHSTGWLTSRSFHTCRIEKGAGDRKMAGGTPSCAGELLRPCFMLADALPKLFGS